MNGLGKPHYLFTSSGTGKFLSLSGRSLLICKISIYLNRLEGLNELIYGKQFEKFLAQSYYCVY